MVQPTTIQRAPRLWVALLGIVILTAAAAFVVRQVYRSRPEALSPAVTTSTTTSATTPTAPTTSSQSQRPGPSDVQTREDAAQHPQYGDVRKMLQDYFDGINDRNYVKWRGSVTRARAELLPEKEWTDSYKSSKDGNIHLYRIDTVQPQQRLRVLVSFTSTQSIDKAPPELQKECIDWHVVLPVTREDNKWKIDTGDGASSPRHDECGTPAS